MLRNSLNKSNNTKTMTAPKAKYTFQELVETGRFQRDYRDKDDKPRISYIRLTGAPQIWSRELNEGVPFSSDPTQDETMAYNLKYRSAGPTKFMYAHYRSLDDMWTLAKYAQHEAEFNAVFEREKAKIKRFNLSHKKAGADLNKMEDVVLHARKYKKANKPHQRTEMVRRGTRTKPYSLGDLIKTAKDTDSYVDLGALLLGKKPTVKELGNPASYKGFLGPLSHTKIRIMTAKTASEKQELVNKIKMAEEEAVKRLRSEGYEDYAQELQQDIRDFVEEKTGVQLPAPATGQASPRGRPRSAPRSVPRAGPSSESPAMTAANRRPRAGIPSPTEREQTQAAAHVSRRVAGGAEYTPSTTGTLQPVATDLPPSVGTSRRPMLPQLPTRRRPTQ